MGKRGKSQKKVDGKPNKIKLRDENGVIEDDMDDEIDACMLINSMILFIVLFCGQIYFLVLIVELVFVQYLFDHGVGFLKIIFGHSYMFTVVTLCNLERESDVFNVRFPFNVIIF